MRAGAAYGLAQRTEIIESRRSANEPASPSPAVRWKELVARLRDLYREFLPEEAGPVSADAFLDRVQRYAELPSRGDAEIATRATLAALADRLSKGQAYDLATPLPVELRPLLKSGTRISEGFDVREHAPEKEIEDTLDQLPPELAQLFW